jgi:hypothetical protein
MRIFSVRTKTIRNAAKWLAWWFTTQGKRQSGRPMASDSVLPAYHCRQPREHPSLVLKLFNKNKICEFEIKSITYWWWHGHRNARTHNHNKKKQAAQGRAYIFKNDFGCCQHSRGIDYLMSTFNLRRRRWDFCLSLFNLNTLLPGSRWRKATFDEVK